MEYHYMAFGYFIHDFCHLVGGTTTDLVNGNLDAR